MAHPQEMSFHPSSPPSEGGADSYKHEGTPDTRLTTFSPLEDSTKSSRLFSALTLSADKAASQTIKFDVSPSIHHAALDDSLASSVPEKDPFITSTPEKRQTKLSATASSFQPLLATPVSPLVANGSANMSTPRPLGRNFTTPVVSTSPNTGMPIYDNSSLSANFSSDLKLSRSLRIGFSTIGCSTEKLAIDAICDYFKQLQKHVGSFERYPEIFPCNDATYVRATNIRDALKIMKDGKVKPADWKVEAVSAAQINKATGINVLADDNEGLHSLFVMPIINLHPSEIQDKIRKHFKHYDIFALARQPISTAPGTMQWVMEWAEVKGTWTCALYLYSSGWINVEGLFWMILTPYAQKSQTVCSWNTGFPQMSGFSPNTSMDMLTQLTSQFESLNLYDQQTMIPTEDSLSTMPRLTNAARTPQWPGLSGVTAQSSQASSTSYQNMLLRDASPAYPKGRLQMMSPASSTFSMVAPLSPQLTGSMSSNQLSFPSPRVSQAFHRSNDRRQNALRVNRGHFSPPGPHHNHVDINKIREGTDVRTTIMLRNIPNKVDQAMLKNIVDESSWGKYDFMYLRIDFANDCNVGYAFINFVDPLDIIDFVNARGNQRWNCFKSDKIAEISYATIQGKDCLVQKFRNSSVMLEAAHYRPKLYYTSNGPTPQMAGNEEPFPEPDNQSKMKRSCENAEHVGLFTPNAGQHFRDEQRRRRSQYDRGTRLAALEEGSGFGMYPHSEPIH